MAANAINLKKGGIQRDDGHFVSFKGLNFEGHKFPPNGGNSLKLASQSRYLLDIRKSYVALNHLSFNSKMIFTKYIMTTITTSPLESGYDFFITDRWGKEYHFRIISFDVPSGMLSVAVEVAEETEAYNPRRIEILSDYDVDIEFAELQLKGKVKEEINQKSLKMGGNGAFEFEENSLTGVILADHEKGWSEPLFAVDGKKITVQQFCDMLSPYCTFKFRFEIIDPSE